MGIESCPNADKIQIRIIGPQGAGKSTLAREIGNMLVNKGLAVDIHDGDVVIAMGNGRRKVLRIVVVE